MSLPSAPVLKYSPKSAADGSKFAVRILRPKEYALLREHGAIQTRYQAQMDALLLTGMRYVEAQRLHGHPEWFQSPFVSLPPSASLKGKRRQLQRWVKLGAKGVGILPLFLSGRALPTWETWTLWLREWAERAGMDPTGLGPKTMRKTWESWLVFMYPEQLSRILLNQGHTGLTSVGHYLNMPFLEEEKEQIKPYVEGMF